MAAAAISCRGNGHCRCSFLLLNLMKHTETDSLQQHMPVKISWHSTGTEITSNRNIFPEITKLDWHAFMKCVACSRDALVLPRHPAVLKYVATVLVPQGQLAFPLH